MDPNSNWNFSNMFQNPNFQTNPNSQNPNLPQNFPHPPNSQNPFPQTLPQNFSYPQNTQFFPYSQFSPNPQYPMFGQIPPYHPYYPIPSQTNSPSATCSQSTPVFDGLDTINLDSPHDTDAVEENRGKSKTKSRWTQEEDYLLVSSWLNTSKDSVVGTDQSADSFWKTITKNFNAHVASIGGTQRSRNQCKDHWSKGNKLVTYFAGCYKRASDLHRSGWSDADYLEKAKSFYKQEKGKDFLLIHWWEKVKGEPKWNHEYMQESSSKRTKVSESGAYTSSSNADRSDGSMNRSRPIGQKAAKKGKGKKKDDQAEELIALEKEKLAIWDRLAKTEEAKVEALRMQAESAKMQAESANFNKAMEILTKDSSKMNEAEKRKHDVICSRLMEKYFP